MKETLKPFFWVEHDSSVSLCLNVSEFKAEVFDSRADEGFEGNGYDWGSLIRVYMHEKTPHLAEDIDFDPEADMFVAYSKNPAALEEFALGLRAMCDDDDLIMDLFSRAEID